jgi:peptide deformylase
MLDLCQYEQNSEASPCGDGFHPTSLPTKVCLNPKILSSSEEIEQDWEMCLSVPGLVGSVPRPNFVEVPCLSFVIHYYPVYDMMFFFFFNVRKVQYITEHGDEVTETLYDLEARVFQHE